LSKAESASNALSASPFGRHRLTIPRTLPSWSSTVDKPDRTLKQKAYEELKEFLAISLYLWLVLGLFVLYQSVISAEHGIPFVAHGLALINALAMAKVLLLAKDLHFAERFKGFPLIYPTIFKSGSFAAVLGIFKVIEEAVIGLIHGRPVLESISGVGGGTIKGMLSMLAILVVLLVPFFGFTELRDVIGVDKLRALFFTSRNSNESLR
jgi:hypothetical protein